MPNLSLIKPRILVVDDTLEIWDLLSTLLVPDGYLLKFAADGAAALRLAEELRPDLILLDVQMPGMDGFEVCQRLRAAPLIASLAERLFAPQPREQLTLYGLEQFPGASLVLNAAAMETILGELMTNAMKFHPAKSPRVAISLAPAPDGYLLLRVTDDGLSLTPEQRELAFTPYYQGEKDHTGEVPGMGLGLSMVGSLVLEAGGQCRLLNRADAPGIVAELTLPLAARPT
jgi:CheY-like chemotaxis protein